MENELIYSLKDPYQISAVIPTYNREKTIARCIKSVLNQTYPVFEIIVVDDGSTDNTLHIIEREFADSVTVVRQKHKGAQAARNVGIHMATGQYIAFLDSDDEWMPDKIELQVRELKQNKYAVVCGNGYIQRDWANDVPDVYRKQGHGKGQYKQGARRLLKLEGKSGFVYKSALTKSFCLFPALLTSKGNLEKIGLLDESVPSFQEWDTFISLSKEFEVAFIQKPLFIYHLHDGDTISKGLKKDIVGFEYICDKYKYEILNQLGAKVLVQRYKEIMKRCFIYKDLRIFKYLVKYLLGTINIFVFK